MTTIARIAVLGAGTMGQGIAQLCAAHGMTVHLYDAVADQVRAALQSIEDQLDKLVGKSKMSFEQRTTTLESIKLAPTLGGACDSVDLLIEAVPEILQLKVELLKQALQTLPSSALIASNTSSLSVTELGQRISAPERTIGLHFFNPPPVMPLLEIVRGIGTSENSIQRALAFAKQVKKEPIVVRDTPGFASSRLGVILGAEAMRMLESGVASTADIDRAMELGYRHPMGPLKLTDLVGLDVRLSILEHLFHEVGEQFRPPIILRQMVRAGRLGKKVGIGFYRWTETGPEPVE